MVRNSYKPFGVLRFVLALLVLTQHFCGDIAPAAIKQAVFPWAPGNVAVLCFFIMSGFIICEAYHDNYRGRPFAYIENRFMRIVPGYWAALIVSVAAHFAILSYCSHPQSMEHHALEAQYFGLHNLAKNFFAIFPPMKMDPANDYMFIPYAWALKTEMMFYLTVFFVGFAYIFLQRVSDLPQGFWLSLAGLAATGIAIGSQLGFLPQQLGYGPYFVFGGALFFVLSGERKALAVLLPAFAFMLWNFKDYSPADFSSIAAYRPGQYLLFGGILVAMITLATMKSRRTKIDQACGELSYPVYLNHYVVAVVIFNLADHFSAAYLLLGLLASLVLSEALFLLVEKPLIKVRRAIREKTFSLAYADPALVPVPAKKMDV